MAVEEWFGTKRFALLLGCLIAACFPTVLLGTATFFFRDFAFFSYPLVHHHREAFWNGEVPLWNPYNNSGIPFLAQWNTMTFYPLTLIYLILPLPWSLNLFCLVHLFLAGMGMYFLARNYTTSSFAAAVGGLAYTFSGFLLSCLKWPHTIASLAWMPFVVLGLVRSVNGNWRDVGIAALLGALQMLTGTPEVTILTWVGAGVLAIVEVINKRPATLPALGRLCAVGVLVVGLSSIQLLPFLDLLQHSDRDNTFTGSMWPMPSWGWANFLVPLFHTFPSYHGVPAQPQQYWISSYYVPIAAIFLLPLAWRKGPGSVFGSLLALLITSMLLALGENGPIYSGLRELFPPLSVMRYPIKFLALPALILPLLAAIALGSSAERPDSSNRAPTRLAFAWFLLLGILILGVIFFARRDPSEGEDVSRTVTNGLARLLFLGGFAALYQFFESPDPRRRAWATALFAVLVVADGISHSPWQNPVAPRWVYQGDVAELHPRPALGEARAMISSEAAEKVDHLLLSNPAEDVLASRGSLYANINLLEKIPKTDGFFSLYPRHNGKVQQLLYGSTNSVYSRYMDFLGVTHTTTPGKWMSWQTRHNAMPLITAGQKPRLASDTETLEAIQEDKTDFRQVVFLATENSPFRDNTLAAKAESQPEISGISWQPHRVRFQLKTSGATLAVIAQSYYHCWDASLNGSPLPIFRANLGFQAIEVPAGSHEVILRYNDKMFQLGQIISAVSGVLLAGLLLSQRK